MERGDFMKKLLEGLGLLLGILIGIPIFFLVCIGYLLYVPFDILKYHKMPYYRDLRHKYKFLITKQDAVKFYNYAAKQD